MIKQKGFTLLEVLVALILLSLILAAAVNAFSAILRSATKAKTLAEVRQNGQYALGVMERMIRNARSAVCNSETQLTIENPDGKATIFVFDLTDDYIASQSAGAAMPGDTDRLTNDKVKLNTGQFSCTSGAGFQGDAVSINFNLSQTGEDVSTVIEEQSNMSFQTTVVVRNY